MCIISTRTKTHLTLQKIIAGIIYCEVNGAVHLYVFTVLSTVQ